MYEIVTGICVDGSCYIQDTKKPAVFLHSNGLSMKTVEYFPTKAYAQKILDKFYPKPEHEWKHGDVFENSVGKQIYLEREAGHVTINLERTDSNGTPKYQLDGAKFLFNIKEKL